MNITELKRSPMLWRGLPCRVFDPIGDEKEGWYWVEVRTHPTPYRVVGHVRELSLEVASN